MVGDILTRDWYFESDIAQYSKEMEDWETSYKLSSLFESIIRDWLTCGNHIVSTKDWMPVQLTSILGLERDKYGVTQNFIQKINFSDKKLPAKEFLHTKYIDIDRQAWGLSHYHALMTGFSDLDGRQGYPTLEIYRQMEQDISRTHHKYASPRVIYQFDGVSKDVIDNQLTPLFESMGPGDRLVINHMGEILQESVDPKARFTDSIQQINDEVEAGLQTSANRLITKPSAMADAGEAGQQDDDRILTLMEKLRRLMDEVIIPTILGTKLGECSFKWGAKDSFDLVFPQGLQAALNAGLITTQEGREILISTGWKIDESVDIEAINNEKKQAEMDMMSQYEQDPTKEIAKKKVKKKE